MRATSPRVHKGFDITFVAIKQIMGVREGKGGRRGEEGH